MLVQMASLQTWAFGSFGLYYDTWLAFKISCPVGDDGERRRLRFGGGADGDEALLVSRDAEAGIRN